MIQRILPSYFFTLECFFLYFLLFFSYIQLSEVPPPLYYLVIVFLANLIFNFTMRKKVVKGGIPFFSTLFLGGVCYFFDFTLLSILICTVFLYLRIDAFLKDSLLWSSDRTRLAISFYGISFVIFIEGWIFSYPYMNWLFGIVIIFTALYIIGRFLQQMDKDNRISDTIHLVTVLGISILITGIVTLLVPITKWIFFKLTTLIAIIASLIGIPIFHLFEGMEVQTIPKKSPFLNLLEQMKKFKQKEDDQNYLFDTIPIWGWILLVVIILIIIWYLVRKRISLIDKGHQVQTNIQTEHSNLKSSMRKKRRFLRQPTPNEYMRKLFHQLQIYAEKYELGRHQHETIREWFSRVEFPKNEELFLAYESVRYGKNDIQKEDAIHLAHVIEDLKIEIKIRNKKE